MHNHLLNERCAYAVAERLCSELTMHDNIYIAEQA